MRAYFERFLLLSVLLLVNVSPAMAELREGKPAPAVRIELLDGGTFDSVKQRGKVIVLNVWATWCKPCREEMPALDAYYRAHRTEGLEVIAISIEGPDDLGKIRRAMKGFSFSAALAPGGQIEGYGLFSRIPVTFVIDRRGVLRFDGFKFARPLDLRTLEKIVTPLLRNSRDAVLAETGLMRKMDRDVADNPNPVIPSPPAGINFARNPLFHRAEEADSSACAPEVSIPLEGKVPLGDGLRMTLLEVPHIAGGPPHCWRSPTVSCSWISARSA